MSDYEHILPYLSLMYWNDSRFNPDHFDIQLAIMMADGAI